MPEINIETQFQIARLKEHIRPVMTTGLGSNLARNAGGSALGNIIIGQPAYLGNSFLDIYSGHNATDNLSDAPEETLTISEQERFNSALKRDVYDFATFLVEGRGCDINLGVIAERLSQTSSFFGADDSLKNKLIVGTFMPSYRAAHITAKSDSDVSQRELVRVGMHEMTHSASGNIYTMRESIQEVIEVTSSVLGLKRGGKFGWLNEGLTEIIVHNIMTRKGMVNEDLEIPYPAEVDLLNQIMNVSGISANVFLEAYFEEPDLLSSTGERMPKWHKLQRSLADAFGPKFLLTLEEMLKVDGADPNYPYDQNKMLELVALDEHGYTRLHAMRDEWYREPLPLAA